MYRKALEESSGLVLVILVTGSFFLFSASVFSFEIPESSVAHGMGNAYSVVGHENGLLKANPATAADTHLFSIGFNTFKMNDSSKTMYVDLSAFDSTQELAGGMLYGRIFSAEDGGKSVKIDNFYFSLAEHYSEMLYFGLAAKWIKDYVRRRKGWDLDAGMMVKFSELIRFGVGFYNFLKYSNSYFPEALEFSIGSSVDDFFRGEVDWVQHLENGWKKDDTLIRVGVEFLIYNTIGLTAGWNLEGYRYNTYSGGIYWRYPRGIVSYSFSSNQKDGEVHMLTVEVYLVQ